VRSDECGVWNRFGVGARTHWLASNLFLTPDFALRAPPLEGALHSSLHPPMKRYLLLSAGLLLVSLANFGWSLAADADAPSARVQAFFSPRGGCTLAIVKEIGAATKTVDVEAYQFTSKPIALALIAAKARGVKVRVVLDARAAKGRACVGPGLKRAGIEVWVNGHYAIFHDKVMVIDQCEVLSGSFNFSDGAENRNAENLLILRDASELAAQYEADFERHRAQSTPLGAPIAPLEGGPK